MICEAGTMEGWVEEEEKSRARVLGSGAFKQGKGEQRKRESLCDKVTLRSVCRGAHAHVSVWERERRWGGEKTEGHCEVHDLGADASRRVQAAASGDSLRTTRTRASNKMKAQ
eukprot:3439790-Pleurochrysis_carterae.AAC.2